jgi:adenosylcobinamide kinase / adenosylcobinamide-phosphate guanylyltransferase
MTGKSSGWINPGDFSSFGGELITFIIGGARSGKSAYALEVASALEGRKAYVATAQALDYEMAARIKIHKQERGPSWDTLEEPLAVSRLLNETMGRYRVIVIDCLTLWLSNLMHSGADVQAEVESFITSAQKCGARLYIVSNEVGMGIVPENQLARMFRDHAGMMNRRMAGASDEVYLLAAGIPVRIK